MDTKMVDKIKQAVALIPEQGAQKATAIIARSFYRDMRLYGFNKNQIINVATELIDCINKSLACCKEKLEAENS